MKTMRLTSLLGNSQNLDGGAMFGNAPKGMWQKWVDVDEENRIALACRSLLIQETTGLKRNILLEAGVGDFFSPKLKERYGVTGKNHILLDSLQNAGLKHTDIDIVILSHLHFDHVGGLVSSFSETEASHLLFPNATYICSDKALERATNPHPRDKASYIPHINQLLINSGRLQTTSAKTHDLLGPEYLFHYTDGHTPGMLLTEINSPLGPILYGADLIPGHQWMHVSLSMGYDRNAELVIDEKKQMLDYLFKKMAIYSFVTTLSMLWGPSIKMKRDVSSLKNLHNIYQTRNIF